MTSKSGCLRNKGGCGSIRQTVWPGSVRLQGRSGSSRREASNGCGRHGAAGGLLRRMGRLGPHRIPEWPLSSCHRGAGAMVQGAGPRVTDQCPHLRQDKEGAR